VRSSGNTAASDAHPAPAHFPALPVIGRVAPTTHRSSPGRGGPPQFPPPPSKRSTPHTPRGSSGLRFQALHPFHGLRRVARGSAPPLSARRRADNDAAGFALCCRPLGCSPKRALDAGLRPGPFPDQAASPLSGLLAATRTGLTPAGDDELMSDHDLHIDLQLWAHSSNPASTGPSLGNGAAVSPRLRGPVLAPAMRSVPALLLLDRRGRETVTRHSYWFPIRLRKPGSLLA
jgi:hypothetical protein